MSRWRPPPPGSTALITREGFERLRSELDELWRVRRPEVVQALSAAAAEGDRSENAEYHYRKKQLAEIDRRVRYLGKRLPALKVVEQPPSDRQAVYFGASVELLVDDDTRVSHRIVGPDETDARRGDISIDAPLARALLRRRIAETIEVALPGGRRSYQLLAIAYAASSAIPGAAPASLGAASVKSR